MEREWVMQRAEMTAERLRFYSPRGWLLGFLIAMLSFGACGGWAFYRSWIPGAALVFVILLVVITLAASLDLIRRSPEGMLHFQVDRTGVSIGGLAFRPVAFIPFSRIRRILVGRRFTAFMAPVLFEIHPTGVDERIRLFLSPAMAHPTVVRSYYGTNVEVVCEELSRLTGGSIPIVRFEAVDDPASLAG